jgi:hypothetical protein
MSTLPLFKPDPLSRRMLPVLSKLLSPVATLIAPEPAVDAALMAKT